MQKNAQVHAGLGRHDHAVGGVFRARRLVCPVQRPPDAAVVRQPARRRVPPDVDAHGSLRTRDPPRTRSGPRRRGRVRRRQGRPPRPPGARRFRPPGSRQDERRQGRARSSRSTWRRRRSTPPLQRHAIAARAEQLDPTIATTAFIKDDREGKVFVDSTRVGGATVAAPYSPRARSACRCRPGVVEGPRRHRAVVVHDRSAPIIGDTDLVCADAGAAWPSSELVEEGHAIPVSRAGEHEGSAAPGRLSLLLVVAAVTAAIAVQTFDNWAWGSTTRIGPGGAEAALSDRSDGTDPWERGDPRKRGRDGRAGGPSWNAGGDGPAEP